jgi:hypothetical protein
MEAHAGPKTYCRIASPSTLEAVDHRAVTEPKRRLLPPSHDSSSSNAFASFRSGASKPSVNQW